jgi:hypothetical protein
MRALFFCTLLAATMFPGCIGTVVPPGAPPFGAAVAVSCPGGAPATACNLQLSQRSAVEFAVAANPRDARNAVVVGVSLSPAGDRLPFPASLLSDLSSFDLPWWVTHDGGATWAQHAFSGALADLGPLSEYDFAGDPSVAFSPDGAVYVAAIAYRSLSPVLPAVPYVAPPLWKNTLFVIRSTDGGDTFSAPVLVDSKETEALFHDRPGLSAGRDGRVFVGWYLEDDYGQRGGTVTGGDYGIRFALSEDRGEHWLAHWLMDGSWGVFPSFAEDGQGVLHAMWFSGEDPYGLMVAHSTDHGRTFTPPALAWPLRVVPWIIPHTQYRAPLGPTLVALPGGRLLAVTMDLSDAGDVDILLLRSDDHGATWNVTRLNRDPTHAAQFLPALAADASGHAVAAWLDRRDDPDDKAYRPYAAFSMDGERFTEIPLSSEPSPKAGSDGAYWVGDTIGVAVSGDRAYVAWPDLREGDGTVSHPYAAALALGP